MINTRFQLTEVSLMPRTFGMWAVSLLTACQPENCFPKFGSWQPKSSDSFADWSFSLCPLCFLLLLLDDTALRILISRLHVRSTPWLTILSNYFSYDASLCFLAEWSAVETCIYHLRLILAEGKILMTPNDKCYCNTGSDRMINYRIYIY